MMYPGVITCAVIVPGAEQPRPESGQVCGSTLTSFISSDFRFNSLVIFFLAVSMARCFAADCVMLELDVALDASAAVACSIRLAGSMQMNADNIRATRCGKNFILYE